MHRCLTVCSLLLACPCLPAQAVVMDRSPFTAPTLDRLLRTIRTQRVGTLLVVEADGALLRQIQNLLAQDPLVELAVPTLALTPDKGAGKELRERQGWNETARWALMDATGAIRLEGTALPEASVFAEQLLGAGFIDRGRELDDFRRKHPESVEALDRLLIHRFRVAQVRMRPLLKLPEAPPNATPEERRARPGAFRELIRPFTDTEDRAIWGAAAELMDALFKGQGWQLPLGGFQAFQSWVQALPDEARHSPLMQDVCRRHLDDVEQVLLRAPASEGLWRLWVSMAGTSGHRKMRDLMDRVVQAPSRAESPLPPGNVLSDFVRECRGAKDWTSLKQALAPRYDRLRERSGSGLSMQGLSMTIPGLSSVLQGWEDTLAPLLEAHLMLGESARAEEILREVLTWKSGAGAAPRASAVAAACGQDDLAKRWAALTPSAK